MSAAHLRIALVYDDSLDRFGGIPQYLGVLAGALTRAGHDVSLLVGETATQDVRGCRVHSLARNVHVRFNGNRLSVPLIADRVAIRALARDGGFDVVHVQVPYSPLMAGSLIRRLPNTTALVGTFHVASERVLPRIGARALAGFTQRTRVRFDEIVCVSAHAADFATATFGLRAPAIVPNMIELAATRARPLRPPVAPTVVSLGALVPRKGSQQLVSAFARVRAELPDARLRLAGDGPMRPRLMRQIRRLGLRDSVEMLGPIAEEKKAEILREAHLACFASRFGESFGIVLLEAIAVDGPAVLAGDNAGYRGVLADAPGSLCRPGVAPLAARMLELLRDDEQRIRLAADQRRLVTRYDSDCVVDEVLALYQRAIDRRRGRDPSELTRAA